jgi:hypothetical protein
MDLTIESQNFRIGSLGSIRISDLAKPDPSASEAKTIAMSESLVGCSSKAKSPVNLATTEITGEKNRRTQRNHGESRLRVSTRRPHDLP